MSIDSIILDEAEYNKLGWEPCELTLPLSLQPLRRTVVLAGKNGAGKSRLLRLLTKLIGVQLEPAQLQEKMRQLRQQKVYVENSKNHLTNLQVKSQSNPDDQKNNDEINSTQQSLDIQMNEVARFEREIQTATLLTTEKHTVVHLVPGVARLVDPGGNSIDGNATLAGGIKIPGSGESERKAPAYLQNVMQKAMEARDRGRNHPNKNQTPEELAEVELLGLLNKLLGNKITFYLQDGKLVANEDAISKQTLSPGQQVLFQFGCILHAQGGSLADCVVIMDEPETHLHPQAIQEVVDTLGQLLTGGQLWIATHSVPLIAHLIAKEPECLWFAEDGKFSRDGRTSKLVLESLMGKDGEGASRLHDFTLLIPQYAALNFSAQCILEPGVSGANVNDRQTRQIARIIEQRRQDQGGKLRVLDFGAGKGRLLPTLGLYANASNCFDYYAYNKFPESREECKQEINAFYNGNQTQRYFDTLLPSHEEVDRFDVIIMCNVLHEVDPDTWLELFGAKGALCSLLATNGALLIVEDYGINVGKRAHRYGFLLMDREELTRLFKIEEEDHKDKCFVQVTSSEQGYENRLTAHLIDRRCVARASDESRKEAIEILMSRMQKELAAMLEKEPLPDELKGTRGRNYARCSQLFVNASLWLEKNQT